MYRLSVFLVALALVAFNGETQTQEAKRAQNSQKPAAPVADSPVKESNSKNLEPKPDEHINADVRIVETPKKDGYDKASFWVTFGLGIIGIVGIGVGICTLLTIRAQTSELAIQNRNMVAKERARLSITFTEEDRRIIADPKAILLGKIEVNFRNIGETPASNIVSGYDAFACESEDPPPKTKEFFHLVTPAFVAGNSFEKAGEITIDSRFSGEIPVLFYVFLRIWIEYEDVFKPDKNKFHLFVRREFLRTEVGYVSNVFWEAVGNPEDNHST
jgi:hypothetical protein